MDSSSSLFLPAALVLALACSGEVSADATHPDAAGTADTASVGEAGEAAPDGGDEATAAESGAEPTQQVLFEASRESSYGSARALNGIYITSDGKVFAFDFYEGKDDAVGEPPPPLRHATEQQLNERWGTVTGPIADVELDDLQEQYMRVDGMAEGVLLHHMGTPDLAELTYLGYRFDPAERTYARVVVGVSGRFNIKNLAPGADELVAWLSSIHGSYPSSVSGSVCVGATCPEPAPDCSFGVPSVEGGCWGSCVRSGYCLEVPDCSWCEAEDVCAVSATGSHHCSRGCGEVDPCHCLLGPCAGGSDFCASGSGLAVTCGAK